MGPTRRWSGAGLGEDRRQGASGASGPGFQVVLAPRPREPSVRQLLCWFLLCDTGRCVLTPCDARESPRRVERPHLGGNLTRTFHDATPTSEQLAYQHFPNNVSNRRFWASSPSRGGEPVLKGKPQGGDVGDHGAHGSGPCLSPVAFTHTPGRQGATLRVSVCQGRQKLQAEELTRCPSQCSCSKRTNNVLNLQQFNLLSLKWFTVVTDLREHFKPMQCCGPWLPEGPG